jgi:hypothetical protein
MPQSAKSAPLLVFRDNTNSRPNLNLQNHPLSTFRAWLFSIFWYTVLIFGAPILCRSLSHSGQELGSEEGKALGSEEGKALGSEEVKALGNEKGKALGSEEVKALGSEEGKALGSEDGKAIGSEEGKALGSEMRAGSPLRFGSSLTSHTFSDFSISPLG